MTRSTNRILTTHAGSLPRPEDLWKLINSRLNAEPYDEATLQELLRRAVSDAVERQIRCGIDIVNDGELGKPNFLIYARERLSGFVERPARSNELPSFIFARDMEDFPEYFEARAQTIRGRHVRQFFCSEPLRYTGHSAVRADIDNLKAALRGVSPEGAFLPAVAPGTIEHWMKNDYYPNDEAYLYAIADAMREEYEAIADSGLTLQIDDPDLGDAWQINTHVNVSVYQKFAELRIDALNHALRNIAPEKVRFHMCWGSYHGPHKHDIPLRDIVRLILKVRADTYSVEASNPRHEHEWRVWEDVELPEGKVLMPGVIGHHCDVIEHPELIAERILKYAKLLGRENVIAGTDCGLGMRVGHPAVVWAKFEAMAEGARIATGRLWGKSAQEGADGRSR